MATSLADYFRSLPTLRPGAHKDVDPTLRAGRPFTDIDLGIPVISGSAEEGRQQVRRFIRRLVVGVVCVAAVAAVVGVIGHAATPVFFLTLVALTFFAAGQKRTLTRWTRSLAILVFGVWCAWIELHPLLLFVVFAAIGLIAADRFATQTLHFQTARPKPRKLGQQQLAVWSKRFRVDSRGLLGSEFYLAGLGLIAFAYAGVIAAYWSRPTLVTLELWLLGCSFAFTAFLSAAFYVLEVVSAAQAGRRKRTLRTMIASAGLSVRRWLRYNWRNRTSIGLYRPPEGSCRFRCRKTLLLGLAAAAATAHLAAATVELTPPVAERVAAKPLRPFELTMLERMSADDRDAWLERRNRPPEPEERQALPLAARFVPAVLSLGAASLLFAFVPPVLLASRLSLTDRENATAQAMSTPQVWNDITDAVREAEGKEFPPSVYLGCDPATNAPLVYPVSAFREHAQILGSPGSGKTSRSLMSLTTQLIRRADSSVVVLDMKGDDQLLFETARIEAERAGMRFRWHTLREGASCHAFNPMTQQYMQGRAPSTVADLLTTALNLQFGSGYGPSFFSSQQIRGLTMLLDRLFQARGRPKSFRELEYIAASEEFGLSPREKENISHVITMLGFCADLDALNFVPVASNDSAVHRDAIDLSHPFRKPQVLFFSLSLSDGAQLSSIIGSLVLNGLVNSSHLMRPQDRTQTFLVIDEFQRLLSPSLPDTFREARSKDLGVIVAHQAVDDLKTRNLDIRHVLASNTGLRQWYTVADIDEAKRLSESAGSTVGKRFSTSSRNGVLSGSVGYGQMETEIPVLPVNDILRASSRKGRSVAVIRQEKETTDAGGFAEIVDSPFTISKAETNRRESSRWPGHVVGTIPAEVRFSRTPQPPAYWRQNAPTPPAELPETAVTIDEGESTEEDGPSDLFAGENDE